MSQDSKKKGNGGRLYLLIITAAAVLAFLATGGGTDFLTKALPWLIFGAAIVGVGMFHEKAFNFAVAGGLLGSLWMIGSNGLSAYGGHWGHEWVTIVNLLLLLLGFALLSDHFEKSKLPEKLPKWLPNGWTGGFVLLALVFCLSAILDNIAAALIGATIANVVFRGKVHIGFLAAVVAASNAGGSPSVVGDTTTTLMWLSGVSPADVAHAVVAALSAMIVCGIIAAKQQHNYRPIEADPPKGVVIDWARLGIVGFILLVAITTNVVINVKFEEISESFPFIGVAVWVAILLAIPVRQPEWDILFKGKLKEEFEDGEDAREDPAFKGAIFLTSLVLCASLMPVEQLPAASPWTALLLGFISAIFDNIPLTALAIKQGGYDWGMLAYCVGFGGSMIWFGSSAGVAVAGKFKEAKSVSNWLRHGWHVALAYVIGFLVLYGTLGWQPHAPHKAGHPAEHQAPALVEEGARQAPTPTP